MIYKRFKKKIMIAFFLTVYPLPVVWAQDGRGINLGKAFKPVMEAMAKRMTEIRARQLVLDPVEQELSSSDSIVVIHVVNNYIDTADVVLRIHNTRPPNLIGLRDKKIPRKNEDKDTKRSLIARDDSSSFYKDLKPYIKIEGESFKLGPGERKKVEIRVDMKDDMTKGEYMAWFAAHVIVRATQSDNSSRLVGDTITVPLAEGGVGSVQLEGLPPSMLPSGSHVVSTAKLVYKK